MTLILLAGLAGGFIDSIIGGGGLVTLPALMLTMGLHPTAIGTNKLGGLFCTLAALLVYIRGRHLRWRTALAFGLWVGLGSLLGAMASPRWLAPAYPFLLGFGTLLCLAAVVYRDRLIVERSEFHVHRPAGWMPISPLAAGLGVLCGFYDGAWGPGGGTFMFLALLYATPLGLMGAIAGAKLVNFMSSCLAFSAYAAQGYVNVPTGLWLGLSFAVGAFAGAKLALRHAQRVLVPLLLVISLLLLAKLWSGLF